MTIITEDMATKVDEIVRLLAEGTENSLKYDGHCKSSEGYVALAIPPFSWREDSFEVGVEVYSYLLGPHRTHYFKNVDEALANVREWHAAEMAHDYSEDMWAEA